MGIIDLVVLCLRLAFEIWSEIRTAREAARARNEVYVLTMTKFHEAAARALERMRAQAREDSAAAGRVDDQVDAELGSGGPKP